jgi:Na+-translocating ferredoxin:NAD+ oxidoreductase RNF subunit RnfB
MTDRQKSALVLHRKWRDEAALELAQSVLTGDPSKYFAKEVMRHTQKIAAIVSEAHCGDCGAHESEPCSATCGYDGPTASDAMADGAAHAD